MGRGTWRLALAVAAMAVGLLFTVAPGQAQTNDPVFEAEMASLQPLEEEVVAAIKASRAANRGKFACPYDTDRAGRSCGKRSACSRASGASVLCYPGDVQ